MTNSGNAIRSICQLWLVACLVAWTASGAWAQSPSARRPLAMEGVTLNGGEFGANLRETPWLGGAQFGVDYGYPNPKDMDYFLGKGMNIFRIPFKAYNLIHAKDRDIKLLDQLVKHARASQAFIILDMHDYGYTASGKLIGREPGSVEEFAGQWAPIAEHFKDEPNVIFGLMCEPNTQSAAEWLKGMNAAIARIRSAGAMQLILAPGSYWSGGRSWTATDNAGVIGRGVRDPAHNFAFEVHQYLDEDGSGTDSRVVAGSGAIALQAATSWARRNGAKMFLGEFGFGSDAASLKEGQALVDYIHAHSDVWIGSAYWGAGTWWGDYMFSVQPRQDNDAGSADKPQMRVLESYSRASSDRR
jgi:endoglucanase